MDAESALSNFKPPPLGRPLRVLLVISNFEFGGAQRQVVELANEIDKSRFDVFVCSLSEYVPLLRDCRIRKNRILIVKKSNKYDFTVPLRLARIIRQERIDLVHAFLFDAEIAVRLAGRMSGVPIVIGSERNSDYTLKFNQRLAYRLTRRMRDVCVANSARGAAFNGALLGHPASHYRVVRNGVDTCRFRPEIASDVRRSLGIENDAFVIGMFASLKPQKNHSQFLGALKNLIESGANVKALFVGEMLYGGAQATDVYRASIMRIVADCRLSQVCYFVGNVDNVESYYAACNITVLPSIFEGTPNVILESMAMGIPVIATDVSSNTEIIKNGSNGFLVEVNDVVALEACIRGLYEDRKKLEVFGLEARRMAESLFSVQVMVRNMSAVYEKLISNSAHREK